MKIKTNEVYSNEEINNKIHIVKDNTRDKLSSQEDRTIKYSA